MIGESGFYIYGSGPRAVWMGVIDGPFKTEELAVERAWKWKMPKFEDGELEVKYSETGEDT